jgi:hypothetical protein
MRDAGMTFDMWIAAIAVGWPLLALACCVLCGAAKREMPAPFSTPIDEIAPAEQLAELHARFEAIVSTAWPSRTPVDRPSAGIV